MFGKGPSEEINLEAKRAEFAPPDEQVSVGRYDRQIDRKQVPGAVGTRPTPLDRLKRWFSDRF